MPASVSVSVSVPVSASVSVSVSVSVVLYFYVPHTNNIIVVCRDGAPPKESQESPRDLDADNEPDSR